MALSLVGRRCPGRRYPPARRPGRRRRPHRGRRRFPRGMLGGGGRSENASGRITDAAGRGDPRVERRPYRRSTTSSSGLRSARSIHSSGVRDSGSTCARRVAERQHDREVVVVGEAERRAHRARVGDPVRARADAVVPRREHHVLRRAAGVERHRALAAARSGPRRARRRARCRRPTRPPRRARPPRVVETTTKRQGWRFFELPATRPASRMRRCTSSGIGRSAYRRTSRLLATARKASTAPA